MRGESSGLWISLPAQAAPATTSVASAKPRAVVRKCHERLATERLSAHFAAMQNYAEPEAKLERTFLEAIALRRLIVATYNGREMRLAPHQLFARHGELFLGALNTGKNWQNDDDRRLGYFKLEGLSKVNITKDSFDPLPSFDGTVPNTGDEELFSVSAA